MPQTYNVGSKSLFVTLTAWVFIVLAALASVSALLQNAAVASFLPGLTVVGNVQPLPLLTGLLVWRVFEHNRAASERRLIESARVDAAALDHEFAGIISILQARGFKSPYLRSYVVARINPVRFHKMKKGDTKPPMPIAAALTRMTAAAKKFNPKTVSMGDIALVAAVAESPE